jgi:XTP/dITP diphosphohydrolase
MKKLLIATWNPWKEDMFKKLLNGEDYDLVFLSDLEVDYENPLEDWHTVEENAFIKAKYFCELTGIPTLWDDAWFEITELSWLPWVKARRWAWELPDSTSDEDWLEFFLKKVKHLTNEKLEASFPFSRCLYLPSWKYFYQTDKIDILVSKIPRKPFISWLPISSVCFYPDWRHQLDVSNEDPIYIEHSKKEWLLELLKNI